MSGFKANQLEALFVEKFDRTKPDFTALAPRVAQKQPQAVVFVGTGAAVVDGIKALRGAGMTAQIDRDLVQQRLGRLHQGVGR